MIRSYWEAHVIHMSFGKVQCSKCSQMILQEQQTFSSQTLSRCSTIDSYLSIACCSEWCESFSHVAPYAARILSRLTSLLTPSPSPLTLSPSPLTLELEACLASITLSIHFQKTPSSSFQRRRWRSRSLSLSSSSTFWQKQTAADY